MLNGNSKSCVFAWGSRGQREPSGAQMGELAHPMFIFQTDINLYGDRGLGLFLRCGGLRGKRCVLRVWVAHFSDFYFFFLFL